MLGAHYDSILNILISSNIINPKKFHFSFSFHYSVLFWGLHLLPAERMYEESGGVVGRVADTGWRSWCRMLFYAVMFRPMPQSNNVLLFLCSISPILLSTFVFDGFVLGIFFLGLSVDIVVVCSS